jgi:hypothetical protein
MKQNKRSLCRWIPGRAFDGTSVIEAELTSSTLRRTYPNSNQSEEVREDFEPEQAPTGDSHNTLQSTETELATESDAGRGASSGVDETAPWRREDDESTRRNVSYGILDEESNVWGSGEGHS